MGTINPPHFKGLRQWTVRAVEGSLLGVQTEIQELERKMEAADGKAQAHYHKQLEVFKCDWEALQEELSKMREVGAPGTPKLMTPSPQITPMRKELAVPAGPCTLRESLQITLKDLPQWVPEALGDTKNLPSSGKADIPSI